ncbi:MAG: substrate-binding domain-containing protein [Bacteroidota bacterium]|nr:substrate-binding domain-containing protein [Bacteroidota bacterium]
MKNWNFLMLMLLCAACHNAPGNDKKQTKKIDTTIRISVDESFEPVMAEEVKVFESAYRDTKVIVEYKPEAECLRDLEKDSTKIVIISRELNREETKYYDEKIGFKPEFALLAKDAIAVVVNNQTADSSFSVAELKQLLSGKGDSKLKVAIDGNTATSTVRYLKDSLLGGASFGKNVTGAKNSEDLINYVSTTTSAIGFVGISWITDPQNAAQEQAIAKIKMALIECKNCKAGTFARPSQKTITFNQYPLVRGLYYVLKENYPGLGSRFVEFLSTERGQLIFRRALLVPAQMNFTRRRII